MTADTGAAISDWVGALVAISVTVLLLAVRAWISWTGRTRQEQRAPGVLLGHRVWLRTSAGQRASMSARTVDAPDAGAPRAQGVGIRDWQERRKDRAPVAARRSGGSLER
jgi:hypothetical protein